VRPVDDDYREAEVKTYQWAWLGCLFAAVAFLIAVGAAMWAVVWYLIQLIRWPYP
jgi:hypothetical protein